MRNLLDDDIGIYVRRRKVKRKYYHAVSSTGYEIVRGCNGRKVFTHAVISCVPLAYSGYIYGTFTTRLDLAERYLKRWETNPLRAHEIVEVKEITSQEARRIKVLINERAKLSRLEA